MKGLLLAGAGAATAVVALFGTAVFSTITASNAEAGTEPSDVVGNPLGTCVVTSSNGTKLSLTSEQIGNANTIITVGAGGTIPAYGQKIAIATAMQESTLRNIGFGDRDSVGLFQQRTQTGWGTIAQILDPKLSSAAFYGLPSVTHTLNPGLLDIAGWESMPLTVAAQKVQRSAFPDAYAKWEQMANSLVDGTQITCETDVVAGDWVHPLAGKWTVTSPFGPRSMGFHSGTDFGTPVGTPVRAVAAGKVVWSGVRGTYGNLMEIDHGAGVHSLYGHNSRLNVSVGDTVQPGQIVSVSGNTGRSSGPHLHFEIRRNAVAINPVAYMAANGVTL